MKFFLGNFPLCDTDKFDTIRHTVKIHTHTYQGYQVIPLVCSKYCKGFSINIGRPQASRFNNCTDMTTFSFQFTFQDSSWSPFGHLCQSLGSLATILPHSEIKFWQALFHIHILDTFFRQIKSFIRFRLAVGLELQTYYLIFNKG